MRSFSKKLAFVLAAAMVVTSFAPAAKAEAAKEMAINKSSQILYVNEGINHKGADGVAAGKGNVSVYDFSVKNKPADWKDTLSFKWTTSDDEVVAVKAGGVATAVGVGKATITCKVTDKATKETVATLKTKVTVKANAEDVEITNADDVAGLAYEVGATVDLNRAMYDEDGNKTTKRGKLVTDYTRWIAEPSTGVTIDQKSGKFTFAEAGDYTLYCETYQSSKYTKATATSEKITVTVADAGVEIKQTANVKFTLNFGTAVEALAVEDINVDEVVKVSGGNDKINYLVKAVTLAEDKKSAEVEVFFELTDGGTYEVTVKGYDTETFVASNGVPVSAVLHADQWNINKRNVTVGNTATIYATLYDANGIDVTNAEKLANLTFNIKYVDSEYETSDTTLYFTEVGDRAVVTAEYHTNEYLENGDEKDFFTSAPYTFVAVSQSQVEVEKIVKYTTNGNLSMTKDSVKLDNTFETQTLSVLIKMSDDPNSDYLQVIDTIGQEIYSSNELNPEILGEAKFTSLTPDILDVFGADGSEIMLSPRKEGTARVMVSYVTEVNGYEVETAIGIVTIKVTGKIVLTTATLASNTITVCVNPSEDASVLVANPFVQLTVNDQYYTEYNNFSVEWEGKNDLSKSVEDALSYGGKGDLYADAYGVNKDAVPDNWMKGIVVDGETLLAAMDDLKGNGKNNTTFSFTVTVKETVAPYGQKTINFNVNAKRATNDKNMSVLVEVSANDLNSANKNVARFDTPENNQQRYYDRSTENQKDIKFSAYYAYDRNAKWQEIELLGILPDTKDDIKEAATGCYYVINKGGKNITEYANQTLGGYNGAKNEIALKISDTKTSDYSGKTIPTYEKWEKVGNVYGAGNYEFIVYEIVNNKDTKFENKVVQKARTSMSVTCDAGAYKFLAREEANLTDEMYETEEGLSLNAAVLRAFKIADKDGSTFQDKNVTDTTVKFDNGQVREYKIIFKDKAGVTDSLYVDKIIFWDAIEFETWEDLDGDKAYETPSDPTVWAEYEVKVGYFVALPEAE